MIPSIRTTYLALSPRGRTVMTFDCFERAKAFVAGKQSAGVKLELAVETRTIRPVVEHQAASVAKLRGRANG
jgi:hypothetical protein